MALIMLLPLSVWSNFDSKWSIEPLKFVLMQHIFQNYWSAGAYLALNLSDRHATTSPTLDRIIPDISDLVKGLLSNVNSPALKARVSFRKEM